MTRWALRRVAKTRQRIGHKQSLPIPTKERLGSAYARCFGRPQYRRMNNLLLYLSMRGLGFDNWRDHAISGEESFLQALLRKTAEHPVVLDVGAYHGDYAKIVRRYSSGARIYCFEPHPRSFKTLQTAAQEHGFTALPFACGAQNGDGYLFDFASEDGSKFASCYEETLRERRDDSLSRHQTKLVTIDEFARSRGIKEIELLKVDVEGAEIDVLQGANGLIHEHRIHAIQFEAGFAHVIQHTWMRDFYRLLIGYSFYRLLPHGLLPLGEYRPPTHEMFRFQNLVAVSDAPRHRNL